MTGKMMTFSGEGKETRGTYKKLMEEGRREEVSEGGGASGSVTRPPGAGTIRVSTRRRTKRRTDFVRRGWPGGM